MNRSEYINLTSFRRPQNRNKISPNPFKDDFGRGKHSVTDEIKFAKNDIKSQEEKTTYLKTSLETVIGEFVYADRLTQVKDVTFENGALMFQGSNLLTSCEEAAKTEGIGSRAHFEYEGLKATNLAICNLKPDEYVIQASPPKVADYGFLIIYHKNPDNTINEYLIRYDEKMGSTSRTKELLYQLGVDYRTCKTANDFVASPFSACSQDIDKTLNSLLRNVASPLELAKQNKTWEKFSRDPQVQKIMQQYLRCMNFLVSKSRQLEKSGELDLLKNPSYRALLQKTTDYRSAIVALAKIQSDNKSMLVSSDNKLKLTNTLDAKSSNSSGFDTFTLALMANRMRFGASDCDRLPGVGFSPMMGYFARGGFNFFDYFHGVPKPETFTHYASYQCPNTRCEMWLSGESKTDKDSWRAQCPHCNNELNCAIDDDEETVDSNEGTVAAG